jgi:hypothetical protein
MLLLLQLLLDMQSICLITVYIVATSASDFGCAEPPVLKLYPTVDVGATAAIACE